MVRIYYENKVVHVIYNAWTIKLEKREREREREVEGIIYGIMPGRLDHPIRVCFLI